MRLGSIWNHNLQFQQQTPIDTASLVTREEYMRLSVSSSLGRPSSCVLRTQGREHRTVMIAVREGWYRPLDPVNPVQGQKLPHREGQTFINKNWWQLGK